MTKSEILSQFLDLTMQREDTADCKLPEAKEELRLDLRRQLLIDHQMDIMDLNTCIREERNFRDNDN